MRTRNFIMTVGGLSASLLLAVPGVANAGPKPAPYPAVKSSKVAAPFNLDVRRHSVLVADGGLNLVGKLKANGDIKTIAAKQPGASGVATSRDYRWLAFTTTVTNPDTFENTASKLRIWGPWGSRVSADTLAYERKNNPDKRNHYGVENPSDCVRNNFGPFASYQGQVDSHAYSVAAFRRGWVVADAGANALLTISNSGEIRTLAVLPPQPVTIDEAAAKAIELPDPSCFKNPVTYNVEPVPTDVEVGKDGFLYVTTLPGGPESPALGGRGKVWKVNPRNGKAVEIAGGFVGATNLALGKHGEIYVAELFGAKISVIKHGRTSTYVNLPNVVAVETGPDGTVWAGTMASQDPQAPAPGTIVKIVKGKVYPQT